MSRRPGGPETAAAPPERRPTIVGAVQMSNPPSSSPARHGALARGGIGGHPHRRHRLRDDQAAGGGGHYLIHRDAGRDLPQYQPFAADREKPEIGDDKIDDPPRRHRDRAALNQTRAAVARGMLHRDKHMLG